MTKHMKNPAASLRKQSAKFLSYAVLIAFAFVVLFPILWMFSSAFKSPEQQYQWPPQLIPWPLYPGNFTKLLDVMPIGTYLLQQHARRGCLGHRHVLLLLLGRLCHRADAVSWA